MKIGIVGAGNIGGTLGLKWGRAGHSVLFASRNPHLLNALVEGAGPAGTAGLPEDAARFGEAVLIATPFGAWPSIAEQLRSLLKGKTVIDASNVYPQRDGAVAQRAIDEGFGSGAFVQALLPESHIVKAFNTLYYKVLEDQGGKGIGLAYAGNDAGAIATVSDLIKDAGFVPILAGKIGRAKDFDPGTTVYGKPLPAKALATALGAV
jgi:predicted dinucleotide-binding enzyme